MSCGNPHELDCRSALDHLYEFLDGEVAPTDHEQIAHHLQECAPCLQEYDVERIVKALVARSCCEVAPSQLRSRLVAELVSVRIQIDPPDCALSRVARPRGPRHTAGCPRAPVAPPDRS